MGIIMGFTLEHGHGKLKEQQNRIQSAFATFFHSEQSCKTNQMKLEQNHTEVSNAKCDSHTTRTTDYCPLLTGGQVSHSHQQIAAPK